MSYSERSILDMFDLPSWRKLLFETIVPYAEAVTVILADVSSSMVAWSRLFLLLKLLLRLVLDLAESDRIDFNSALKFSWILVWSFAYKSAFNYWRASPILMRLSFWSSYGSVYKIVSLLFCKFSCIFFDSVTFFSRPSLILRNLSWSNLSLWKFWLSLSSSSYRFY